MNKEIEEMAKFIHGRRDKNGSLKTAEALYNAGYRKVVKKTGTDRRILNIQNLLAEFDEMDYAPTNLCENPEKEAIQWKKNLICEINVLLYDYKAEIERLEKVVADQNELCWNCKKSVKVFAEKLKKD